VRLLITAGLALAPGNPSDNTTQSDEPGIAGSMSVPVELALDFRALRSKSQLLQTDVTHPVGMGPFSSPGLHTMAWVGHMVFPVS
jgi:hypothetical protein